MSYQDLIATIAGHTEDALIRLHDRYQLGEIDYETFLATSAAILVGSRASAVRIADLAAAAELTELRAEPVLPHGLAILDDDTERVADAVIESLESDRFAANSANEMGVLARALVFSAAAYGFKAALEEHGVKKWTRVPNQDACPACVGLAGTEQATTTDMWRHKGCNCAQKPTQ